MIAKVSSDKIICNYLWLLCQIPDNLVKNSIIENHNSHRLNERKENIRYLEYKHFDPVSREFTYTDNYLITNFSAN